MPDLKGEPWVRFDRDSALDGVLLQALREDGHAPETVARVSQTATAVRWAAQGLGAALLAFLRQEDWSEPEFPGPDS